VDQNLRIFVVQLKMNPAW